MKTKFVRYGPYVLLGLVFLMLIVLNIRCQDHWLDSDMAAEMIFSRLLSGEHHLFAAQDWYYSTEFRVLYTQLVMGPLFLVLDNWHVIRTVTNVIFYVILIASWFYCMKPFQVSRTAEVLGAVVLLLPFSETMMTHMQMGNTYLSHVIICFLYFGMYLRLAGKTVERRGRRLALQICFLALGVICGVSGVRYLLALQCPLLIASLLYLLRAEEVQKLRREASLRELVSRDGLKTFGKCAEAGYLLYGLLGAAASVAGYGINVLWISRRYVFQTYGATNFIAIYQGELFERLQNAIGCLLMLFGYIPEKGFLSLRGVISILAFVLLAVLVFVTVQCCRKETGQRFFTALFAAVAFALNLFVFVFTTSTMVPRYYITIWIFVLPLLFFYLEGKAPAMDRLAVALLATVCLGLGTAKTTLSFVTVDKNADRRQVAAFLEENGYDFGFATYTNGNIITELTNGEVEVANIGDPEYLEFFRWSTPKKYYEEGYHQGETFLLLTAEEYAQYADAESVRRGEQVYEDGAYVVLLYDSTETLMDCAAAR